MGVGHLGSIVFITFMTPTQMFRVLSCHTGVLFMSCLTVQWLDNHAVETDKQKEKRKTTVLVFSLIYGYWVQVCCMHNYSELGCYEHSFRGYYLWSCLKGEACGSQKAQN